MRQTVSRRLRWGVAAYVVLYVAWRLSAWGSESTRALVVDAAFVPPGIVAVVLAWFASQRCGDPRTASAWRWITISFVALTATFVVQLGYQADAGGVPFPSAADACYLSFYALFFVGLLRFPIRTLTRAGKLRLWTDVAIVGLGGASLIWSLVLGPTLTASGQNLLDGTIAGAYPVGDLVQIFVLTYAMTRVRNTSTRGALRLLAVSTVLAVVGDVTMGWLSLHSQYSLKVVVDIAFMAAWAFFIFAGQAQGAIGAEDDQVDGLAVPGLGVGRGAWLPYIASAVAFGLLMYAQFGDSFVQQVTLAANAAVISLLVLLRQFFARRDLLSVLESLEQAETERARLLARTVQVAEQERSRLAIDLHDGPIQQLTALAFSLDLLATRLESGDHVGALDDAAHVRTHIAAEISSLRRLMSELRPPLLSERGLAAALEDCSLQALDEGTSWSVESNLSGVRFAAELETALYRIAREALINVRKHANAKGVEVALKRRAGSLRLAIIDDGKGFENADLKSSKHLGLMGMGELAASVGGTCRVRSNVHGGTAVEIVVPWKGVMSGDGRTAAA